MVIYLSPLVMSNNVVAPRYNPIFLMLNWSHVEGLWFTADRMTLIPHPYVVLTSLCHLRRWRCSFPGTNVQFSPLRHCLEFLYIYMKYPWMLGILVLFKHECRWKQVYETNIHILLKLSSNLLIYFVIQVPQNDLTVRRNDLTVWYFWNNRCHRKRWYDIYI